MAPDEPKYRRLFFKFFAICIGFFLSVLLIELFLRAGENILIVKKEKVSSQETDRLLIFGGDSWTYGADADPGKSFFVLLGNDNDFKKISLVNVGYGGNNCFQVVNAIINYGKIPNIVVANLGINNWHLMGINEFINKAKDYLSEQEVLQLCKDLNFHTKWNWLMRLKIYKLYCYIVNSKSKSDEISLKIMDKKLGSELFWKMLISFREKYQDYDAAYRALPKLLQGAKDLSLDQKFYFVALHLGFASEGAEGVLKRVGIFYPEKLRVFPYETYRNIGVTRKKLGDTLTLFMRWSFKLLKEWSLRNNVTVFIQTYPDIRKENQGDNTFDKINELIKSFARDNGFKVIDHNANGIDWVKYRTAWHVNNEGHRLMKEIIKSNLMQDSKFLELLREMHQ